MLIDWDMKMDGRNDSMIILSVVMQNIYAYPIISLTTLLIGRMINFISSFVAIALFTGRYLLILYASSVWLQHKRKTS